MTRLTKNESAISIKGVSIICHGFNEHFEVPKIDGKVKAAFRTAIVIKKRDFYDEWDVYDNLAWRVINRVAKALSASMRIDCPEPSEEPLSSFEELRKWQAEQYRTDPDFALEPPTQIRFYAKESLLCLMSLEDWSDIWTIEPYLGSFTFSFYSYDSEIDAKVTEAITNQLEAEPEISEVRTVREAKTPKWYWAITREYSLKEFIKDVVIGMIVIALIAVWRLSPDDLAGFVSWMLEPLPSIGLSLVISLVVFSPNSVPFYMKILAYFALSLFVFCLLRAVEGILFGIFWSPT